MSNQFNTRDAIGRHYGTGELANRVRQALHNASICFAAAFAILRV
jgi:hypothetical protein